MSHKLLGIEGLITKNGVKMIVEYELQRSHRDQQNRKWDNLVRAPLSEGEINVF